MSARRDPPLARIALWWEQETDELPGAYFRDIGLGEPSCRRCGWLAPVDDLPVYYEEHPDWPRERLLRATWRQAGKFLDRAHLADHCITGDSSPVNMIPLCHYPCHHDMPELLTREAALQWVAAGNRKPAWWQMLTDGLGMDGRLTDRRQLRGLYRWGLEHMLRALEGANHGAP